MSIILLQPGVWWPLAAPDRWKRIYSSCQLPNAPVSTDAAAIWVCCLSKWNLISWVFTKIWRRSGGVWGCNNHLVTFVAPNGKQTLPPSVTLLLLLPLFLCLLRQLLLSGGCLPFFSFFFFYSLLPPVSSSWLAYAFLPTEMFLFITWVGDACASAREFTFRGSYLRGVQFFLLLQTRYSALMFLHTLFLNTRPRKTVITIITAVVKRGQ